MQADKNKLWDVDEQLFISLEGKYSSENEAVFFRNMRYKQECEISLSHDLIVSERDNEDEIYVLRIYYDEYRIGIGADEENEVHVMNLSEALSLDLKKIGYAGEDITLWEWLRKMDYCCVSYQRNCDKV